LLIVNVGYVSSLKHITVPLLCFCEYYISCSVI